MKLFLILLMAVSINAALPPDVQDKIDARQARYNKILQNASPIIVQSKVLKVSRFDPRTEYDYYAYNETIELKVQVVSVQKNDNKITLPKLINIKYTRFVPDGGWVGPAWFDPILPREGKVYTFYLNDDLTLSARDESICDITSDFKVDEIFENTIKEGK